jgi:peptide/nickel transport system ATP-binding protein
MVKVNTTNDAKRVASPSDVILSVRNLKTYFYTEDGVVKAVDDVSFNVRRGRTLAIVGESGSGKSVSALSVMRLISPPGRIVSGEVLLANGGSVSADLLKVPDKQMRGIRGKNIAMIFQEPMTSLNPVFTLGNQIIEAIRLHNDLSRRAAKDRAIDMLRKVKISLPEKRVDAYPHELSGGMRQRAMIAMALSCNPDVLIADEPTTALDVTVQAQILQLLEEQREQSGMGVILITHDLGVVAETADDVCVMYASKFVELGPSKQIFGNPKHPYTVALMRSIPHIDAERGKRLATIEGTVPDPLQYPTGCRFHPRCWLSQDREICKVKEPELESVERTDSSLSSGEEHLTACHFSQEVSHDG